MLGSAGHAVHVDIGAECADRLIEHDLAFLPAGSDPNAAFVGIQRSYFAAKEFDISAREEGRNRGDSRRDRGHNALLQPHAFQEPVGSTYQRDAQFAPFPTEPQRSHEPGVPGAQNHDIVSR